MSARDARWSEPERLAHEPELAALFERAQREYQAGIEEPAAFQRLSERLEARAAGSKRSWNRVMWGTALSFAAVLGLVWLVTGERAPGVLLGPEVASQRRAEPAQAQPTSALAQPADVAREADVRREADLVQPPAFSRESKPVREKKREPLAPKPTQAPAPRPALTQEAAERADCLDLARRGEPRSAETCFSERASGSGLSAEMALYELSRLRRDVLRDPEAALRALDDYRQRFPAGTLRNEVDVSRVELLAQLGRGREALRESEALLAASAGKERAAELHVLRGDVLRKDLVDLPAAIREYALAEPFGGTLGAEATRLRGVSLEALGDGQGALGAYQLYLSGPERPQRAEVERRVRALAARGRHPASL